MSVIRFGFIGVLATVGLVATEAAAESSAPKKVDVAGARFVLPLADKFCWADETDADNASFVAQVKESEKQNSGMVLGVFLDCGQQLLVDAMMPGVGAVGLIEVMAGPDGNPVSLYEGPNALPAGVTPEQFIFSTIQGQKAFDSSGLNEVLDGAPADSGKLANRAGVFYYNGADGKAAYSATFDQQEVDGENGPELVAAAEIAGRTVIKGRVVTVRIGRVNPGAGAYSQLLDETWAVVNAIRAANPEPH